MRSFFVFVALVGVTLLSVFVLSAANPAFFNRYKRKVDVKSFLDKFHNEDLDEALERAGFRVKSYFFNSLRYGFLAVLTVFAFAQYYFVKDAKDFLVSFFVGLAWFVFTHPGQSMPFGFLLKKIAHSRAEAKNGQLLSFIQLYRSDRSRHGKQTQFWNFCYQVAPNFPLLEKDLIGLASRATEEGIESALAWFQGLFPKDHPFAGEILSMVLSAEKAKNREAVKNALERQGELLAKISSSRYATRWKTLGDFLTAVNTLPAIAIIITMIILILKYITIINKNLLY